MSSNIFVQIGLQEACELAEIENKSYLFENDDNLFSNIWSFPKEIRDRLGNKQVVGVDMNPKSIEHCKEKYKDYNNVDFIHAAIVEKPLDTIISNGWSLEQSNSVLYGSKTFLERNVRVPALTLSQLFEKLQTDGDIIVCVIDVEGYEYQILKGHDWKIKPNLFWIEGHIAHRTNMCISILLNNGYYLCDYSMHRNPYNPNAGKQGIIKAIRKDILVHPKSGKHLGDDWDLDEV